jgi:hypothetical protein
MFKLNEKKSMLLLMMCTLSILAVLYVNTEQLQEAHKHVMRFIKVITFPWIGSSDGGVKYPVCTLGYLKKHAQHHRNYAKMPFSQIRATTTVPPLGKYDCWFDDSQVNSSRKAQCDTNTNDNVRSILQFGDSNGRRYAEAFISNLGKRGWKCSKIKQEQPAKASMPDPKYFVKPPSINHADIRVSQRSCHGCISLLAQCSRAKRTLTYEYLALQFFSDNEVTTNRTHYDIYNSSDQLTSFQNSSSTTQQEFIFREYLADRYPDVVIYFVSSHFRHKLDDVQPLAASFFDIIERHLPPTSRVIIASSMKRVYGTAHKHLSKVLYERNFTANDMQLWLNARVYDAALSRLVDPVKRWYAFPSLYDVSNTTDQMYADHVHRTPVWYQSITRYLLQLICLY